MSAAASATTSAATPGNNIASMAGGKTESFRQFTYFVAMYGPNMIVVVLQSAWLVVFATVKMMSNLPAGEPWRGISTSNAVSRLPFDWFVFLIRKGGVANHWVMVLAGQGRVALALVVPLVSESMSIVPTAYCKTEILDRQPCSPKWVVNIPIILTMEVFLVACFSMVLMILILNRRRVSGVYFESSRIATMADILIHKSLIQEIRDSPTSATKSQIEIDLRDSGFCMLCCSILFMLITIYNILPGEDNSASNMWISSGEVGPNLLLSAFVVSIDFLVKRKERSLRLSYPYVLYRKVRQPQR
ncbi:hypothetical protein LTR70_006209 [Exophiala xenobiotica]|uniref:Uncharacterized protein n=1 Tax=Lithohypha guttulata TaxID=1690604 RepID=A0ABR0K3Q6_9EURO|nr:hypothetical protein LTR24_007339 [Lithohypha guttulata]KAK5316550.1 hypothetical protein LTR70_006209 [Exophiala xenobiotica]